MNQNELGELLRDCPVLFHMTEAGSWPAIEADGLLSTSALLDLYGVTGAARTRIEACRRPESVALRQHGLPGATVRDQVPMDDASLRRCLQDGLEPADWYRLLNGKVFFWLTRARLQRLLNARLNRNQSHDVLELNAASLVAAHRDRITLSPINSGTSRLFPVPRGRNTFLPIHSYPYAAWRQRRPRGERVIELAVEGGVPDVRHFVRRVVRQGTAGPGEILFERQDG